MGIIKSIGATETFPEGCRVQVFDRFRLASGVVTGMVAERSSSNDGVAVTIDEEYRYLFGSEKDPVLWFRPQQLLRVQTATEVMQKRAAGVSFGAMMEGIKAGHAYRRKGWNGKGIYIIGQFPDAHSKMTQPYIYIVTHDLMTDNPDAVKGMVPWLASQTDMFAEDWVCLTETEDRAVRTA